MRVSKIRTSFIAALFFLIITSFAATGQAQTISPPPTAAGYPFWKTFDAGKITRGNDGAVWFAGNRGLIGRLSLTGALKNYTVEPLDAPNGGASLWSIYWGTDNNVWYGTFSGIVGKLNPATGAVTRYQLPEGPVFDLTRGPDGNMWFTDSDDRRMARISPATGVITYFEPVGQGQFSVLRALSSASDGNLYFTGVRTDPVAGYLPVVGKIPLAVPEHAVGTNIYPTQRAVFSGSLASLADFETINGGFFNATVHWGDGTSSKGTVTRVLTGNPNEVKVLGSHTYANKGKFTVNINVSEPSDQYSLRMQAVARVQ